MLQCRKMHSCLLVAFIGVCCLAICSHAFADECQNLAQNEPWNEGMTTLSEQMSKKQWDEALKTSENLSTICDRSPILNYAIGRIYREKGNASKALYYMQRATLFTEEFAVKGKTLEQMWFDRYEAEHPDARPDAIEARKKDIEVRDKQIEMLKAQTLQSREDEQYGTLTEKSHYGVGMWTGVAVTGIGLVLTSVGSYLVTDGADRGVHYDDRAGEYNVKDNYGASWAILGVGLAATVVGVAFTGVMGYYYTHTQVVDSPVAFHFSPIGADLTIQF